MKNFFDLISETELNTLNQYMQLLYFSSGDCLLKENEKGDYFYILKKGIVKIVLDQYHSDDEPILGHINAGSLLGEMSILDNEVRSASAYAETDVEVYKMTINDLNLLSNTHPQLAAKVYCAMASILSYKLRNMNLRYIDAALVHSDINVDAVVKNATLSMSEFQHWNEEKVDDLLYAFVEAFDKHSEALSKKAVELTGIGNVKDKLIKNKLFTDEYYKQLKGKIGYGEVTHDLIHGRTEIANPLGVILAIIPITNPIATTIFKILVCLKNRNAVIFSFSSRLNKFVFDIKNIIEEVLRAKHAPIHLLQVIDNNSQEKVRAYMLHKDVSFILATGGPGLVKAAYSSGKPVIGVGAGNAPVLIAKDANLANAAKRIIQSRTFDNGIICASEQILIIEESIHEKFFSELIKQGAAFLNPDEIAHFTQAVFNKNNLKPEFIGKSAQHIADQTSIKRNYPITIIVAPIELKDISANNPYCDEKLAPILSSIIVPNTSIGLDICCQLLEFEGAGHTAVIYTESEPLIKEFSLRIPASRILINSPSVQGVFGVSTDLPASCTLGCGTWGRTSTTDSIGYTHLRNIKYVGRFKNKT